VWCEAGEGEVAKEVAGRQVEVLYERRERFSSRYSGGGREVEEVEAG